MAANIRAGWKPGVSSRGLGSVKDSGRGFNIVQEGFRLTVGVDVVWGPSAPEAYVTPFEINESINTNEPKVINKMNFDNQFLVLTANLGRYK